MCVTPAGKIGNCTCGMPKLLPHSAKKNTLLSPFCQSKPSRLIPPATYVPGRGIRSCEAKSPRATDGVASSAGTTATVRKSDRVFRKLNTLALLLVPLLPRPPLKKICVLLGRYPKIYVIFYSTVCYMNKYSMLLRGHIFSRRKV